jgi:thioredoxin-like negative regulator of GroEL
MLDRQLRRLRDEVPGEPARVRLVHHEGEGDAALAGRLAALAETLRREAGLEAADGRDDPEGPPATPALTLAREGCGRIHYLALPDGLEAEPFVDLLVALASNGPRPDDALARRLAAVTEPVELLVFVMTVCPHCARAVRAAHALALASPRVTVAIVDAARYPDLAERFRVMSAPVTLVDRGLALSGAVGPDDLVEAILARGGPEHEARVLASMAEAGRFPEMVERLLSGDGARTLAAAWRDSTLALRLGLLVAVEEVLETSPRALDAAVEDLLPSLDAEEAPLRGDTADLLGKIGHESALPALVARVSDPHPDVAEAVAEALARITALGHS